jgi:hypothetical protein
LAAGADGPIDSHTVPIVKLPVVYHIPDTSPMRLLRSVLLTFFLSNFYAFVLYIEAQPSK